MSRQQTSGINEAVMSPSVCQTSYDLMCRVLRDAVQAGPGAAGGIGSVEWQAVVTLYMLLMDHPIDRRGRCRSCRRTGAVFGPRWRCCRVLGKANMWLRQLDEALLARLLVHELGLAAAPRLAMGVASGRASASDADDTDMLPAIAADRPTEPLQTPAVPPTPPAEAGWPDLDHGGAGDDPMAPVSPCSTRQAPSGQVAAAHRRNDVTDWVDAEDERHQQLLPVASVSQGVEHLLAGRLLTAGFARAAWPEAAPVPDLSLPLATMGPEQCGDRAAEAAADGAPDAD